MNTIDEGKSIFNLSNRGQTENKMMIQCLLVKHISSSTEKERHQESKQYRSEKL